MRRFRANVFVPCGALLLPKCYLKRLTLAHGEQIHCPPPPPPPSLSCSVEAELLKLRSELDLCKGADNTSKVRERDSFDLDCRREGLEKEKGMKMSFAYFFYSSLLHFLPRLKRRQFPRATLASLIRLVLCLQP